MFEMFTDPARHVVVRAQEAARMLNHDYIGTEHILLGLLHEREGVAVQTLEGLGISTEDVRQQVEEIVGRGPKAPSGHISFTPRAKKALELSLRESRQLGHDYIGTEHILLGLIREGEGVAVQVLVKLGANLDQVRQRIVEIQPGPGRLPEELVDLESDEAVSVPPSRRSRRLLRELTAVLEENDVLRAEIERLRRLLAKRGIDPASGG